MQRRILQPTVCSSWKTRIRRNFEEAGLALDEINSHQLHKEQGFETFETYVKERWEMSKSYAYKLIRAAKESAQCPIGHKPANVHQALKRRQSSKPNSGIPPIFDLPGISLVMSSSSLEKAPAVTSGRLEQNLNQRSPGNLYNAGPVQSTTGTQRPRGLPKKGTSGLSLAGRQQPFLRRSG
jgi:hypothetical protein